MNLPRRIVIATRESRLALWHANHVRTLLAERYPEHEIMLLGMTTRGDQILDQPLAAIGGKGLFIKELEMAMQEGRAHLAVHSMKDVPMELPAGFRLAAILSREDPRDAFVSPRFESLESLPPGSVVGTSSLRREVMLRARYPHLLIRGLRGNLDTRLRKLDDGLYDAIILAAAGLIRLGYANRIRRRLDPEEMLPAPGQGAIGIEVLAGNATLPDWLAPLADAPTDCCVRAERAFSQALGGSCQLPLGGYAVIESGQLWLRGFVATSDGSNVVRVEKRGDPEAPETLGSDLAADLLSCGGGDILARASQS